MCAIERTHAPQKPKGVMFVVEGEKVLPVGEIVDWSEPTEVTSCHREWGDGRA